MAEKLIPLGVHFGLDEDLYHADPALGSTDIRSLRRGFKLKIETKALTVGKAMHACVLEPPKFRNLYVRRPDDPEDASAADKGNLTKKANKEAAEKGQTSLHGSEYDLITSVARAIDTHPDLSGALKGAANEVSIFWERDGVRMKCRIDGMKPRGSGDLKSIANEKQDRLSTACKWAIKRRRYDIQAEYYMQGRDAIPALVKAGKVFFHGEWDGVERKRCEDLLEQCVAVGKKHAFQFIFVPKDGSPAIWSCILSRQNDMLKFARGHIEEALDIYRRNREAFADPRWALVEPVQELDLTEMPGGEFGWD